METWIAITLCAFVVVAVGSAVWFELANIRQDIELIRANIQQHVVSTKALTKLQIETLSLRKEELELRSAKRHIQSELDYYNHKNDATRYQISPLRNDPS
jgi:hypothetical protein